MTASHTRSTASPDTAMAPEVSHKTTSDGAEDHSTDMGPLSPSGVKALKIAILVMTLMIVGGVALIIGRIIYLASTPRPDAAAAARSVPPRHQQIVLPAGARISETSLDGQRLLIRYQIHGRPTLLIYDLGGGKVLSRIAITESATPGRVPMPGPNETQ